MQESAPIAATRPPHRPTKFTPRVRKQIIDGLASGMSRNGAARSAGIAPVTFRRWRRQAEQDTSGVFAKFARDCLRAEAEAERRAVEAWQAGFLGERVKVVTLRDAEGNVTGTKEIREPPDAYLAAKFVERRWPSDWHLRRSLDVSIDEAATSRTIIYDVGDREGAEVEAEIAKAEAGGAETIYILPEKEELTGKDLLTVPASPAPEPDDEPLPANVSPIRKR